MTGAAYRVQLQALLPHGAAWPREEKAQLTAVLDGLAQEFARVDARAEQLMAEAIPATTGEMLSDWERVTGLPDNCSGILMDTQQRRRDDLVSKLISQGGQSRAYFKSLASAMGFDVQISEHRPFMAGSSSAGDALTSDAWRHTWTVQAPETTVMAFAAGRSAAGEPLALWGNEGLECRIRKAAPAHTRVLFSYGGLSVGLLLLPDGAPLLVQPNNALLME